MENKTSEIKYIIEKIYSNCGLEVKNLISSPEVTDYEACTFELNGHKIISRTSNITPTKIGQFVAIWQRNAEGITAPYDADDDFDFMIISSRFNDKLGQFIFSKEVLIQEKVLSNSKIGGKRGIRVYPVWDEPTNKQAIKTQAWQSAYFIEIDGSVPKDLELLRENILEKLKEK